MSKPILCLDFDGVLHSYTSGWKGHDYIPDPPVPGAIDFLAEALEHFTVAIHSSRSHQGLFWSTGRWAMKRWLKHHIMQELYRRTVGGDVDDTWYLPENDCALFRRMTYFGAEHYDPHGEVINYTAGSMVREIKWPLFKPPALMTIDDRGHRFTGEWPSVEAIFKAKPWNKQ